MLKRLHVHIERIRASLFFVPAVFVAIAILVAGAMLRVDLYLSDTAIRLPAFLQTTPDSVRSLLGTVASATIGVAGVVFAITLVSIQLAASQFSPRVIPGFLRDSRQQLVMGLAVGTFTYCLVVLRAVHGANDPSVWFIPHLSSALSLVLAIVTIVALIAFLDRSARTMQVGNIIHRLTNETTTRACALYPDETITSAVEARGVDVPSSRGHEVKVLVSGWVRHIDLDALLRATPGGGITRLGVRNGSFIAAGQSVLTTWPAPEEPDAFDREVRAAIMLGDSRLVLQDVAFGIRQLVDIGLRALSPGINDPTTAYDVIVHLGVVFRVLLWRDLSPTVRWQEDRCLVSANDLTHEDYVNRAFDQLRLAGASQSAIAATLIQTLGTIADDLERGGLGDRARALRRQATLTLATYAASAPLAEDLARVAALAARRGMAAAEPPADGGGTSYANRDITHRISG